MPVRAVEATDESVLEVLLQIRHRLELREGRYLAKRGLTGAQFRLLLAALSEPSAKLGDLAEQLGCTRGNLTITLDGLERGKWLLRDRPREDRRTVRVKVAEKAKHIPGIKAGLEDHMGQLASIWSADEGAALTKGLWRLYGLLTKGAHSA